MRIIFNPIDGKDLIESAGGDVGRGIGMIRSVIAGLAALAGAYMNFTAHGGELSNLTDVDKLKSSFAKSDASGATPPPPPPSQSDEMPPPPPPTA